LANLMYNTRHMVKMRILLMLLTFLVVGILGTLAFFWARGYRFNIQKGSIEPQGLLVAKSNPDGAELYINGELKSATNITLSLSPGNYDVKITKSGYSEWSKRITIKKEEVSEVLANLYKTTLSLSSVTSEGSLNPSISQDLSKIAYIIPYSENSRENAGLWILENINLPLGFSRDPKRITDGDLSLASWVWSPDSSEILLTTPRGNFLLPSGEFTPQTQVVNITQSKNELLALWDQEANEKLIQDFKKLPKVLFALLSESSGDFVFSPDGNMLLYKHKGAAEVTIPQNLIAPVPGASTQKEERIIKSNQTYIYDVKEDRNFLIDDNPDTSVIGHWTLDTRLPESQDGDFKRSLTWYPSSKHVILAEEGRVSIVDYDGTNKKTVYSGSYSAPYAFPTQSLDKILILTNLGSADTIPNLYSLSIK